MANANLVLLVLANTFGDEMTTVNNLANSINELRNGNYYKDLGSFTLANGGLTIAGSGTLLSVGGNATISQQLTVGSIQDVGQLTVQGNTGIFTSNNVLVQVANTLAAANLTSNNLTTLNKLWVQGQVQNTLATTNLTSNGIATLNNLIVQGNLTVVGQTINSTDTLVLRANISIDGNGKIDVYRGTTVGANAQILFNAPANVWQLSSNDAQTFNTILTTANLVDTYNNTSTTMAATANAVNAAYTAAISSAVANSTAIVANNNVYVAQRKGLNFFANGVLSLNVATSGANANLTDIHISANVIDNFSSNSTTAVATANSVNAAYSAAVSAAVNAATTQSRTQYVNVGTVVANTTIDISTGGVFDITLAGNPTLTFANTPNTGSMGTIQLIVRQTVNGSNTISYSNTIRWSDSIQPILTTTPNTMDVIQLSTYNNGSFFIGAQVYANVAQANRY